MKNQTDQFCQLLREKYPYITKKADELYRTKWYLMGDEFLSFAWFEELANALNSEMINKVDCGEHIEMLKQIETKYKSADNKLKEAIDVSFVENLFWKVPEKSSRPYWQALPKKLRELYLNFHTSAPR